jgi:hypothetical protein
MKKSIIIFVFVMFSVHSINAQEYKTSLGLRIGPPPFSLSGITIKHFLDKATAIEGILSFNYNGIVATGLFQSEHWTGIYPGINWYWGLGAHVGIWGAGENPYINSSATYRGGTMLGIDGILGVEYTFDNIPLNIAIDVLPTVNLLGYQSWNPFNAAVSVRYVF